VGSLFVVLVLDVHVQSFDVLGLRVTSVLVKGQVVVGKVTLELTHVFDKCLVLSLKRQVGGVVLVDVLDLLLHLVDFAGNIVVLVPEQVVVVVAIVDLSAWADTAPSHSRETMVGNGAVHGGDLGVVADAPEVDLSHCGALAHSCAESSKLHLACWFKFKL